MELVGNSMLQIKEIRSERSESNEEMKRIIEENMLLCKEILVMKLRNGKNEKKS